MIACIVVFPSDYHDLSRAKSTDGRGTPRRKRLDTEYLPSLIVKQVKALDTIEECALAGSATEDENFRAKDAAAMTSTSFIERSCLSPEVLADIEGHDRCGLLPAA